MARVAAPFVSQRVITSNASRQSAFSPGTGHILRLRPWALAQDLHGAAIRGHILRLRPWAFAQDYAALPFGAIPFDFGGVPPSLRIEYRLEYQSRRNNPAAWNNRSVSSAPRVRIEAPCR